jgi:type III secretion protein L
VTGQPKTGIALTDADLVLSAVAGQRIPRRAWSSVEDLGKLITEARQILENARQQAQSLRRQAQTEGHARGVELGQAEAMRYVLEAQQQAREFIAASEARIVALVVSVVQHIAPQLNKEGELVAAMAARALETVTEEQYLRINVSAIAERAARTMLEQWRQEHPSIKSAQVAVDPELGPYACVIESELGHIEVRLAEQLEAVREGLLSASVEPRP